MIHLGKTEYCTFSTHDQEKNYPRMCECKTNNDSVVDLVDPEMKPIYKSGLHWTIVSVLIITLIDALIGIYASGIAFYNGITKPPQEYLR